jgi:hypothetical protein
MPVSVMRQSGARVRRHSRQRGFCEGTFWRRFDPRDIGLYMRAAERFDRVKRKQGEPQGPLGPIALEILRELLRLVDYKTGRLEPKLETIMLRLRRSKDAVVRALARLRAHGFLDWLRRWEPGDEASNWQNHQTSNAYRLLIPPAAWRLLGFKGDPPSPDDDADRRAAAADVYDNWKASAANVRYPTILGGNNPAMETLERMSARREATMSPPPGQNPARFDTKDSDAGSPDGDTLI